MRPDEARVGADVRERRSGPEAHGPSRRSSAPKSSTSVCVQIETAAPKEASSNGRAPAAGEMAARHHATGIAPVPASPVRRRRRRRSSRAPRARGSRHRVPQPTSRQRPRPEQRPRAISLVVAQREPELLVPVDVTRWRRRSGRRYAEGSQAGWPRAPSSVASEESPDTVGQDAGETPDGESRWKVAQKGDRRDPSR